VAILKETTTRSEVLLVQWTAQSVLTEPSLQKATALRLHPILRSASRFLGIGMTRCDALGLPLVGRTTVLTPMSLRASLTDVVCFVAELDWLAEATFANRPGVGIMQ